jgi:hypothetical protein
LKAKSKVTFLKAVNDTAERAVKLMQDFHGLVTAEEEQIVLSKKQLLNNMLDTAE